MNIFPAEVVAKLFDMSRRRFNFAAMVRGYHVCQHTWAATVGVHLKCQREAGSWEDPFAVAVVMTTDSIVGHVFRKISITSLFVVS